MVRSTGKLSLVVLALFALLPLAAAQVANARNAPKDASALIAAAQATAKRENKKVLVIFGASWCGWCKKLDAFLADKEMKKLVESSYAIVHLDVLEQDAQKHLENPGGTDQLAKMGGTNAGLPFYGILDSAGKVVITSSVRGKGAEGNIGYPAAPHEIGWFMTMLKETSKLTPAQQASVRQWLTKNAPKL